MRVSRLFIPLLVCSLLTPALVYAQDKVKVFLLAGQSNMVGHGRVEIGHGDTNSNPTGALGSLRYQVNNDPANYGHLVDANGDWVVRDDAWVYSTGDGGEKGPLTTEFGASYINIGPEFGFGFQVADFYDEPVLLVKAAWGGKSLGNDFLPPSAESYPEPAAEGDKGYYYKLMLETYHNITDNLDAQFPTLAGKTPELEGFVWFQGYNDQFNATWAADYEKNLAHLINDVRSDLNAPNLPVVVAATGNGGFAQSNPNTLKIIEGQEAVSDPSKHPEFAGTVGYVETRGFWRDTSVSPTGAGHHWNANGESYFLIGDTMGRRMLELVPEPGSAVSLAVVGLVLLRRRRPNASA